MGFSQAVSGLNAASSNLDVIGNNIANSETTGFKGATVSFADIFADSAVGLGVKVAAVTQNFNDGTIENTDVGTDVAISGNGFYRVADDAGSVYYTRNGEFQLDADRNLTTKTGYYVTGYAVTGTPPSIAAGAEPTTINISAGSIAAQQTSTSTYVANLNSSTTALAAGTTFDATDSSTYSWTKSMTTYDSLGNTHVMNLYFSKTADNTWEVHALDSSDSTATAQDLGTLNFSTSGQLTGTTAFNVTTNSLNGSAANTFSIDFVGSTQQNASSSELSKTQNGYTTGNLVEYAINDDGTISGTYSNGQTQLLGQIVLATFSNSQGLKSEGDNVWSATSSSGEASLGTAGTGLLGSLTSGALESSNVDIGSELVDMIVAQRNYQSNAQTIKTQDSILNTLVNLR
ncbi:MULTISPECIES: flagellar hook protein FlgE [Lonsdalea]|uniref:Flagellar biosynthesis protein FlgE n=3 Tax=Lonsdalea TaxID=1082702 RepID=A0ACD1J9R9_9GAMM|nr:MULTISPECIES: flagellar hook protein FlgE [Lonsdalea]OSM94556.1 flagellar biosynthesis protein FlgE [Lonsdalea populi]OSN01729.1 flagellar biosynthesis protein FlgE [Lonsdalea populi]QPQ25388.1 flagellar hook protein FlgE [Lonsdalea populi]RAT11985.1 flagellar biosynthesis protein FlgE [Lonsdalea quercina]RAT17230.1 flagellar biosynthesis protein FlgE [Lonsdalea quercina]